VAERGFRAPRVIKILENKCAIYKNEVGGKICLRHVSKDRSHGKGSSLGMEAGG